MLTQGPFRGEGGKDPKGVDALRHTTSQAGIDFAKLQHLSTLDNAQVAACTGSANAVVGSGNPRIEGDLTGGVVGHCARVVVVRPIGQIVVVLRNFVDLLFGLDVAVLGGADVDTNALAANRIQV